MTPEGRPELIGNGLQITFAGGSRSCTVWRERDGGYLWEFEKDGARTPLWLSLEAMNVMLELHHQASWMVAEQESVTPTVPVAPEAK